MQGVDTSDPMWRAHPDVWQQWIAEQVRGACGPLTVKHARLTIERHRILLAVSVADFEFLDEQAVVLEMKAVEIEAVRVQRMEAAE
jgi:hypothetical protein